MVLSVFSGRTKSEVRSQALSNRFAISFRYNSITSTHLNFFFTGCRSCLPRAAYHGAYGSRRLYLFFWQNENTPNFTNLGAWEEMKLDPKDHQTYKMEFADGSKEKITFLNGKPHGKATRTHPDGTWMRFSYSNGRADGRFTMLYPSEENRNIVGRCTPRFH